MKGEEEDFVEGLIICAKWGFPLNTLDLRLSAKAYLDRIGKSSRAAVDAEMLSFFEELTKTLEGVKPEAIFNYDESNLSDDPGKKKLIFHRGVKYPYNVINFTKSAVTIILCISANGDILPPHVVYKAANLWDSWREGGPRGAPCCEKKCCTKGT
ncbi:hypothetical protein NQ314_009630 [Rhamnusium bicolor]|uniref:Transposase n=1 Tax=Rhamnusium bicolor TaxID=1586634 RepID=A0AAV8XXN3_9CUCU|nr:hypothetical protein NQ314_009630 [Rhamnusium bicolor]